MAYKLITRYVICPECRQRMHFNAYGRIVLHHKWNKPINNQRSADMYKYAPYCEGSYAIVFDMQAAHAERTDAKAEGG